ncbi:FecR domain-containing protein [Ulvibacterium sp.]|uniref:FecR family protein n=1 Tax=Ulvibacterium sp. TaxID=2665914 RepID=UPI0026198047|nr:FecR domain-containing protein [Ulvibacterium sp.]
MKNEFVNEVYAMGKSEIKNIITNYFTQSITSEELDSLISWLEKKGNLKTFRSFVEINYTINYAMGQYNSDRTKKRLLEKIKKDKSAYQKFRLGRLLKYAAVAMVFLGIGLVYKQVSTSNKDVEPEMDSTDKITLQLSDGSTKVLSGEGTTSVLDKKGYRIGLQNGNQLVYHKSSAGKKLVFNTLKVPYGKRFMLVLSDGTKVHLNAGTTLRYPVEFIRGTNRQVFLEGEAYFDVAKDEKRPFLINVDELNIQVLGTRFNLSAYPEDEMVKTVLVEGSVGFFETGQDFDEKDHISLQPGFMATWQKEDRSIAYKEVDTHIYTGWMDGKIIFKHIPFKDILKKLERNYDVRIINNNKALDDVRFTASFDTETMAQILNAFNKSHPLHFEIREDNQIIIEP